MERIGIAASKIAKGNLFLYNFFVVLISFLYALLIFTVAGATVLFAIVIIRYVGNELMVVELNHHWSIILIICMITLTIVITVFYLLALSKNLKFKKREN